MANGVQLATAYISLNVRTDDIKKQVSSALNGVGSQGRQVGQSIGSKIAEGIRSSFGVSSLSLSMFNPMEIAGVRWAVKAGAAIGGALKKAIMGAVGGLGIGAIFGVGGVLGAGLDRLKTLQQSTVQLSLKLKPEEIKALQKQISDVVTGTPIPLDKAMQAVPKAINAGLRGDAIKQYIKDIADLTASTGGQGQFDQLAVIMEQIRSKGKLAGDEVQQLVDAGVDVRGILKDTFGWDDKTLEKNLAKGKVGINELQKAIQKSFGSTAKGGLAKEMGNTFDGAIGSLKASAARLGANFIAAVLGKQANEDPLADYATGINKITEGLNGMGKWVDAHRDDIHNVFVQAGNAAKWMGDKISQIGPKVREAIDWFGQMRDKVTEVGNWFSTTWDKATTSVSNLTTKVKTKFDEIKTKVSEIVDDLKGKFDGIFGPDGWFAQQFDKLGKLVDKVRGILGLGEATANAANPGTTPFNSGPMAPSKFGNYSTRAGLAPGTRLDGSDQKIVGGPGKGAVTSSGSQRVLNFDQKITGQQFAWDCGPGSAQIILNGRAVIKSEDQLIAEMGTTQAGTNFGGGNISGPLNKALPGANYSETQGGNVPTDQFFNDISRSVNAGYGAMLNWNTNGGVVPQGIKGTQATPYSGPIAHYVAVMGVDPKDQSMLIADPKDGRQYWITAQNAAELMRNRGYIAANPGMASGGGIRGAGTGTSDSIPAWLSNGEHVLTAADVQAMGGQKGVYAFRNALHRANGGAVGFAPGGAVDPSVIQDAQDNITDLNKQYEIAQAQFNEVMQKGDASPAEVMRAQQEMARTKRALDNASADLPAIMSGTTTPDRSKQDAIFNLTDQLAMAQQTLADQQAAGDVPVSQSLQSRYAVEQLTRERNQAIAAAQGQAGGTDYGQEFVRSLGFIPASAGNTGVAGTSSLAQFIGMGNDIVGGLIDTGTNLAQTAVSAAITGAAAAGSFGAAAPAAPLGQMAASYGIQLLGNQAKRLSAYGFQMAGIGADALMEQLSPFGMPRWLGYDYANFMPQIGIQEAALSTVEKMGTDAINKMMGQGQTSGVVVPPEPRAPDAGVNTAPSGPSAATSAPPDPWIGGGGDFPKPLTSNQIIDTNIANNPATINPLDPRFGGGAGGGGGGGGSWARGGAVGIYDNGGILKPGQLAFNASRTPEGILTKQQWDAMMNTAATRPADGAPLVQNLYAQDMQDAIRQLEKVKRRDMMQYAGRP